MRIALLRLALASCLLITPPIAVSTVAAAEPTRVPPETRWTARTVAVDARIDSLLDASLAGDDAVIDRIESLRKDSGLSPAERDAVVYGYLQRLRSLPPGAVPAFVLEQIAELPPLATTGHEEGPHHSIPLFNLSAAARGLANEWAWREGFEQVKGSADAAAIAGELAILAVDSPRYRGMHAALSEVTRSRLDELALQCASTSLGCGPARAGIELARGNVDWLENWLVSASASRLAPILRRLRHHLSNAAADNLMLIALQHRDEGISALAMSDITDHLPKSPRVRREWGARLVGLLDDAALGGAAALQLARMKQEDWLQAAAAENLGENGRRRLELLAELESMLETSRPETRDAP